MYSLNSILLLLAIVCVNKGNALTCLACDEITHPRHCDVIATCEADEVCFATETQTHDGIKGYQLGCTKRNSSNVCSDNGVAFQCSECCDHDLCNAKACGEQGYPSQRGPMCRSCSSRLVGEPCDIIAACGTDELCSYSQHITFGDLIYTSGCRKQHVCNIHDHGEMIIGKREVDLEDDNRQGHCQLCCAGDLCDTNCTLHQHIKSSTPHQHIESSTPHHHIENSTPHQHIENANDCKDIKERGGNHTSGIYNIRLPQSGNVIPVYCDMETDGGGWTVFQYRFNGVTEFYRNMSDYIHGFGELKAEFWLGLQYIQELSSYCPTVDLRLDLVKSDETSGYETFSNFSLSPAPAYTLHINPGTGTLGDTHGMSYNNGYNFYTFDHDTSYGCAVRDHGAWWYRSCTFAHLNGEYLHPPGGVSSYYGGGGGMVYYDFDGYKSLKSSKMMMRRNTSRKC